jgi:serine protease Do
MIVSTDFRSDSSQLIVERVISQSPSALAGVRAGDRIVSCNHMVIDRRLDFQRSLLGKKKGEEIELVVHRDGRDHTIQLALAKPGQTTFESSAERAWRIFGLQLASSTSDQAPTLKRHGYRGGLRVLAVRKNGLAHQSGINRGDVLVGLHKWEVASFEDMAYITNNAEYQKTTNPKFYIVRSGELLFGRIGQK